MTMSIAIIEDDPNIRNLIKIVTINRLKLKLIKIYI